MQYSEYINSYQAGAERRQQLDPKLPQGPEEDSWGWIIAGILTAFIIIYLSLYLS